MSGERDTAAASATATPGTATTLLREVRRGSHWAQLTRFATVGASGYVVNLAVYSLGLDARLDYRAAAAVAFCVAVVNNFAWNRLWTFRDAPGPVGGQAFRFAVISCAAFVASLATLSVLVRDAGAPKLLAQALAIAAVTPFSFVANKLWGFRTQG
jgi:putative flippase GtrA